MELKNSTTSVQGQLTTQCSSFLAIAPTTRLEQPPEFLSSETRFIESVSASEVEEPAETDDLRVARSNDADNITESIEFDLDDDDSDDTAVGVHIDLLSLQRKVLRLAKDSERMASLPQEQSSGKPPLLEPVPSNRVNRESFSSHTPSTTEDRASSTSTSATRENPILLTDPLGRKWALPYGECTTSSVGRVELDFMNCKGPNQSIVGHQANNRINPWC